MTDHFGDLRRERVAGLARLDLGRFDVGPGTRLIPVSGWLITTDSGRRLLFDACCSTRAFHRLMPHSSAP